MRRGKAGPCHARAIRKIGASRRLQKFSGRAGRRLVTRSITHSTEQLSLLNPGLELPVDRSHRLLQAAAAHDDLQLSSLPQTIFGNAVTVDFVAIKALLIVNTATASGDDLIIGAAAASIWSAPFGAGSHQVRVPANACLLLVNTNNGWPVTAGSADTLRIANLGSDSIDYKIVVVGLHA